MKMFKLLKISSRVVIALGCIHLAATPFIFNFFKLVNRTNLPSIYMFVMVGVFTIFLGWIQLFALNKISSDAGYKPLLFVSVLILCILGVGAVATMWNNPFAYIALIISSLEVICYKQLFKSRN